MTKTRIVMASNSFEEVLRSAYETLNVECCGALLGTKEENGKNITYFVETVHATQMARRSSEFVTRKEGSERGFWSFSGKEDVGGYHSHPDCWGVEPSELDEKYLKERGGKVEVIVSLKRIRKRETLPSNQFVISGHIGPWQEFRGLYRFKMKAYTCNGRIQPCSIIVPQSTLELIR